MSFVRDPQLSPVKQFQRETKPAYTKSFQREWHDYPLVFPLTALATYDAPLAESEAAIGQPSV